MQYPYNCFTNITLCNKTFSRNIFPIQKGITHFRNSNHSQTICFVFGRTISLFNRMSEKQLPKANKSKQNIANIIGYLTWKTKLIQLRHER